MLSVCVHPYSVSTMNSWFPFFCVKIYIDIIHFYFQFRFADTKSRVLLAIGIIASCLHGACMPLMIIVFGSMTDTFVSDGKFKQFWDEVGGNITAEYNVTQEEFLADPNLQR